jgi:hypothetical protein
MDTQTHTIGYSSVQACAFSGLTYRQLDYLARTDLMRPAITDANGSGSARRWSWRQVRILRVLHDLSTIGSSLQTVRRCGIVDRLLELPDDEWELGALVVAGNGACTITLSPLAAMGELGLTVAMVVALAAVPVPPLPEEVLSR